MDRESDTVAVTVQCLCKKHVFSTRIARSALPLKGNACHCTSCRHVSGALYLIGIPWPQAQLQAQLREGLDGGLKKYRVSECLTHLFCGTCSTPLFYEREGEFGVFSGSLSNNADELVHITEHIYVGDTRDGGASVWLRRPNADGGEIPRYEERDGKVVPWSWPQQQPPQQEPDSVSLSCHCKGVDLLLHRRAVGRTDADADADEQPWFIDPRNNKRLASFDACDSCRLHFGNDIVHWTFTDLADISGRDGSAFPRTMTALKRAVDEGGDPAIGTLACYQSSVDAQRYSCGRCGAAVFYACDDRPRLVDVAVGLLDAEGGARAEEYLSWTLGEKPGWVDDVKGGWREGLMRRVQRDAEEFRVAGGYAKSLRRLAKEEGGEGEV